MRKKPGKSKLAAVNLICRDRRLVINSHRSIKCILPSVIHDFLKNNELMFTYSQKVLVSYNSSNAIGMT